MKNFQAIWNFLNAETRIYIVANLSPVSFKQKKYLDQWLIFLVEIDKKWIVQHLNSLKLGVSYKFTLFWNRTQDVKNDKTMEPNTETFAESSFDHLLPVSFKIWLQFQ